MTPTGSEQSSRTQGNSDIDPRRGNAGGNSDSELSELQALFDNLSAEKRDRLLAFARELQDDLESGIS